MGWGSVRTNFRLFRTIFGKVETQIPNSFRKSRPRTASQAKPPQGKWSYTDPLIMRFSSKCVTEGRKPLTFLSNFNLFRKIFEFFLKKRFSILSRLRRVWLGSCAWNPRIPGSENCSWIQEIWDPRSFAIPAWWHRGVTVVSPFVFQRKHVCV